MLDDDGAPAEAIILLRLDTLREAATEEKVYAAAAQCC